MARKPVGRRKYLERANKDVEAITDADIERLTVLQLQRGRSLFEAYDAEREGRDTDYRRGRRETRWVGGYRQPEQIPPKRKLGYGLVAVAAGLLTLGLSYKEEPLKRLGVYGVAPVRSGNAGGN